MSSYEKLKLLIWKNFLLQKRHKLQTVFEILSPVVFSLLLLLVRCLVDPKTKPAITYPAFDPIYLNKSLVFMNGSIGNIKSGTVAFSPENPLIRNVITKTMNTIIRRNLVAWPFYSMIGEPKGFTNANEMERSLLQPKAMDTFLTGIQFDDNMAGATKWPEDIKVTLRFPAVMRAPIMEHPLRASWRTNLLFPLFPRPGPREPDDVYGGKRPGYVPEMFLHVQHALSQEIIMAKSGQVIVTKIDLARLPQHKYREDNLLIALESFVSMIIMLCFAYPIVNTVRVITAEKELQLKETMKIMGLPSWLHWLAWFIKQFSYMFLSAIIMVIIIKIPFSKTEDGERFSILTFTPWTVLFFFMILFIIASLAFCFLVSVFFAKANTAASFMGLAWFTTYSVYMLSQTLYEDISLTTKLCLCLISNTAMGYAFQMIVMSEGTANGLQWCDFFTPISYNENFQPGHVAMMLVLDTVLYMIIAMYVEKIRPGNYGVPMPWYFPVTKSFWAPHSVKQVTPKEVGDTEYADSLLKVVHDEEPQGTIGVNIQNLTKKYGQNKKAVDNLNLRMYENEITVLLGHNGAGKTTTISMLTGMITPTSGTAKICGYDIVTETDMARLSIGLCPQHNVLFPDLTVAEHIIFYSRLKGVPIEDIEDEVNHFVNLLELEAKRDAVSSRLSGGQQRRLSVGAAMCGASRVVLLDEPTSGLDPAARRALWDLLQKEKRDRTIILTTHFMDEADVLGDRIAIMSGGRLQCVGTPYFLKKHYGIGYKLTIVKSPNCDVAKITEYLNAYVPNIKKNTDIGTELTYILPNESVTIFPNMLKTLDTQTADLAISSYGLSVTTLEEVFMKVGAEDLEQKNRRRRTVTRNRAKNSSENPSPNADDLTPIEKVTGSELRKNHIKAMFLKMIYSSTRNKLQNVIQFLSPIINISISVLIARSWKFMTDLPPLELTLGKNFKQTQTILSHNTSGGSVGHGAMMAYKNEFKNPLTPQMQLLDIGTVNLPRFYKNLAKAEPMRVRYENLVGATIASNRIVAWFSNYGYHDSAITLAMANNALMNALAPGTSLRFVNHPLPYSIENLVLVMASGSSMGFQFAFNIAFCMAFVTSFIVLFVIKERLSGSKLLQHVSGVRPAMMWCCAFIYDWIWMFFIHICIIMTLAFYQETAFSTPAELGRVLLVLVVYSVATIPLHYLASFHFESAATGFSKMCFMNMFIGCMPFLITEVLKLPEVGSDYYADIFDWVFSPLPIYCISRSFRDLSSSSFALIACDELCLSYVTVPHCTRKMLCEVFNITVCCIDDNPFLYWKKPGIARYLFMMILVGIICFTLLLLKEYSFLDKMFPKKDRAPPEAEAEAAAAAEDSDVARERAAVGALAAPRLAALSLVAHDLTKYYGKLLAVDRLTFAVQKGECFGLLGINGAGKTTTFKMLTGDIHISSGDAFVHGWSIKTQLRDVHRFIGYCPQFDALFDNLTARETLRIYCLLRGIPVKVGAAHADKLTRELGFRRHFDKKVSDYSGGTKRKLSTALALLGDAPLVFLDEPTTGMDPASKRLVWTSVSSAVAAGRSIVLTSHSMEECEALCSRLTVMVNGKLYCLGPLQHLKNKFSQGYTLIIKCKQTPNRTETFQTVTTYIQDKFADARLIETYLGIMTFYVSDTDLPWWRIFEIMEASRTELPMEDYSVSQTTLEQVFLGFTRVHGNAET